MDTRTHLAARVADIAPFHVMEVQTAARALEAAGRSVVHMEIGEPDFPTPGPVLDAARAALDDGRIYYTSALGLPELRAAIARYYGERYGVDVAPERVVVTAGSSAALLLVTALLVNRDEQILMGDPGLSVQPPYRAHARRGAGRRAGRRVHALPAHRRAGRKALGPADARRADGLAVQSHRDVGRDRRAAPHRGQRSPIVRGA